MPLERSEHSIIRNDIQALRALAVIAVVICHMSPGWLPGGYLGVDVFFVISGFVITQLLLKRQEKIQLYDFWARRIFRIVPAYVVMITVVAFTSAILFLPENFDQFNMSWRKSLLFISNQYFASYGDYFSPALVEQPLLHTWSLAVEMQFYLIYPLVIWVILKLKAPWLLIFFTVIGFIGCQFAWETSGETSANYYALFIRAPEFLLGGILSAYSSRLSSTWLLRHRSILACLGYLLLIYSFVSLSAPLFSPVTALVACLGCALVVLADVKVGIFAALNRHRAILLIGALSYSIYLWHWPILAISRYLNGDIQWTAAYIVLYFAAVLLLAGMSYKLVELNFQLSRIHSLSIAFKRLVAIALVAISPTVLAKQINRQVPSLPIEYTRYADDKTICHGKVLESCIRGKLSNQKILLIGDSHAAQLNLAADVAGKSLEIEFEVLTASSCIPLPGFVVNNLDIWARNACENQIELTSHKLLDAKNIILAGMWTYQLQDPTFSKVLNNFLQDAEKRHQNVWVLAQIPKFVRNPIRQIRLRHLGIAFPAILGEDWRIANHKISGEVKRYSNVRWFDPHDSSLFKTPPFDGDVFIYHDDHHLNELGSIKYGDLMIGLLQPAFHK
jgi:peptidoglycan/LPS O-acetylase OafA/YrhL